MSIKDRLLPVPEASGFKMRDWYVWCGSVIRENGLYYLFAARWPEKNTFPDGYMFSSEIVLAVTDSLDKPFVFRKVIIDGRGGDYWDGKMAHNPFVFKSGDEYVLFYIGTPDGSAEKRAIGYAHSKSLTDGWVRSEKPLDLPANANNPSVLVEKDRVLLYFRDGNLKVSVASSDRYDGQYTVLNDCLFTKGPIEDMYVYKTADGYEMIAEDARGVYTGLPKGGVLFRSDDGIHWDNDNAEQAFTFDVEMTDGTCISLQRRERPVRFFDGDREWLITTAKLGGPDQIHGGTTWNMVQEIAHGQEL